MSINWTHVGPTVLAAFSASLVEFVEALTVILAVGVVRGWRAALFGAGVAVFALLAIIAAVGPALTQFPLAALQLAIGTLLLLFGMRWLRKAILRASGLIPMHDEAAIFSAQEQVLRQLRPRTGGLDMVAFATAFKITMIEGTEVVFIVIALGAGGAGLLIPASLGALAALIAVVALGMAVHRPLSQIPENTLKFGVGVLLSAFGTFWVGEGLKFAWPGEDWSILGLISSFLIAGLLGVRLCRRDAHTPADAAYRETP
jgi:uncharacterized membrane protein